MGVIDNIVWHGHAVERQEREHQKGHRGIVLWFTGLSGSGKSTVANEVDRLLYERSCHSFLLDGDNVRHGLNGDLGFSEADREENIRRTGEVAKLFADAGLVTLVSFISPFRRDRERARELVGPDRFVEVLVSCPLDVCEGRDPKGLYKKARSGEISDFTGISSPFEEPAAPDVVLRTDLHDPADCALQILNHLEIKGFLKA